MQIPTLRPLGDIELPEVVHLHETGNWELYHIPAPGFLYARLDIFFIGGRHVEHKRFLSKATALLLKHAKLPDQDIDLNEALEDLGASVRTIIDFDHIGLSVSCLKRNLASVIHILKSAFRNFDIDDKELNRVKKRSKSLLKQDEFNAEMKSYRLFTEELFGPDHVYGYNSGIQDIESIVKTDVIKHFEDIWLHHELKIFCTGDLEHQSLALIMDMASRPGTRGSKLLYSESTVKRPFKRTAVIGDKGQASLKVGMRCFPDTSDDLLSVILASIWLGGFFGSVLMRKIREEAGLTYGIHGHLEVFSFDGMFVISTDCRAENTSRIEELIEACANNVIENGLEPKDKEMIMRYLKGHLMSNLDGTLNQLDTLENFVLNHSSTNFFGDIPLLLDHVKADGIQRVTSEYLHPGHWSKVIVDY